MNQSDGETYQPSCILAHDLINRLSVIAGYCDLLRDEAPEDSECYRRLLKIREIAHSAATDLNTRPCPGRPHIKGKSAPEKQRCDIVQVTSCG
jgi:hypothetical protein